MSCIKGTHSIESFTLAVGLVGFFVAFGVGFFATVAGAKLHWPVTAIAISAIGYSIAAVAAGGGTYLFVRTKMIEHSELEKRLPFLSKEKNDSL